MKRETASRKAEYYTEFHFYRGKSMTGGSTENDPKMRERDETKRRKQRTREKERERERERRGIDLCTAVIACFILISVHTMTVHRGYIV